jgi:hypothetical protein
MDAFDTICVKRTAHGVLVSDRKQGADGPQLFVSSREWRFALNHTAEGMNDYDELPPRDTATKVAGPALVFARSHAGDVWVSGVTQARIPTTLTITQDELASFVAGVKNGQFDTPDSAVRQAAHVN